MRSRASSKVSGVGRIVHTGLGMDLGGATGFSLTTRGLGLLAVTLLVLFV